MSVFRVILLILHFVLCHFSSSATNIDVSYDGRAIKINGERRIIFSGSIHYPRSTIEMWPDLIQKAKEGGLDAIETYVFWNAHEPQYREYNFMGNLDIIRFLKTIQDAELFAILRIGPYVDAEWNYGGLPVWLHNIPGIQFRTNNDAFKREMKIFTSLIVDMAKREKLFASQGGPIILAQIENEYGNVKSSYGDLGKSYVNWCAETAQSLGVGIPWIMCQEEDAPQPMINTCNGWYCDSFFPNNPDSPKMWTENWTGWYKNWGGTSPHRTAEDIAFAVARFFQYGGTFQNYYMYHGGTNFGRNAGGPYITTSYDYDAPLDEYGNLNQPKWGHLKQLNLILKSMQSVLTYGDVSYIDYGNEVLMTRYKADGASGCLLANANSTTNATIFFQGREFFLPAWSVSIIPDCKKEAFNTAKVNTQSSIMVKKINQADEDPSTLKWVWKTEHTKDTIVSGTGSFVAPQLLEQKAVTNDTSDYLWYMSSFNVDMNDPILSDNMILRVNSSGHVLHAYLNGKHIGSQWAKNGDFSFRFEESVQINIGSSNQITLLSVTVGLQSYGANFDLSATGISGVELIGIKNDEQIIKDLSSRDWTYKVGLHGEEKKLYSDLDSSKWHDNDLHVNKMMTWYKTNFVAPLGSEPVVVNLEGMGKGHAWVNGKSIGRYWPSLRASVIGCTDECDYRGAYDDKKCVTNCGQPSQIWYHIPRSFLKDDTNTLVLFEEIGGNPNQVSFQTVTVGRICGKFYEGSTMDLSCHGNGKTILAIEFASFGDPQGTCGSYQKGVCEAANTLPILQEACVGHENCSLEVSEATFGESRCGGIMKSLVVQAVC